MKLTVVYAGRMPYREALELQYRLHAKRVSGEIGNVLLLLEHPPVLTLGMRGEDAHIYLSREELDARGVEVFQIDRGGDVTYHGPGQIVGYFIFDLRDMDKNIRLFVERIEQGVIRLLHKEYGIEARRDSGKYTGVWAGDNKIAAIGISVKKWVTMHGFAFNVNTDLSHFDWINPCGLSRGVTSVERLTGKKADLDALFHQTAQYLAQELGCAEAAATLRELLSQKESFANGKQ